MKYTHMPILAICLAMLSFASCNKSDYDGGNNTILANNSAELLKDFRTEPTKFTVVVGVTGEVQGPQGTFLRFYPTSFRDKNGNTITSGMVNIELTEMYAAGDMLKYHTSTNTGSALLTSGGQVFIKATKDGEEVSARKYGIGFNAALTPTGGPRSISHGHSYAPDGVITWYDGSGETGKTTTGAGPVASASITLTSGSFFMFDSCSEFNWVSCNKTHGSAFQKVTVNVKLTNESFAGNVWSVCYAGLNTERVATVLYQKSFDRNTQTGVYEGWVPTGIAQKFMLVIPRDKDTWYYFKTEQIISDGLTLNATLTKATKDEMNTAIKGF
jgi:hypothetical protein